MYMTPEEGTVPSSQAGLVPRPPNEWLKWGINNLVVGNQFRV